MRSHLAHSLFARLLWSVLALVLAAMLLVSAVAIYLLPPPQRDGSVVAIFLGLGLLILGLVALVVYLFAQTITRPLAELARATRAAARGELEAPLNLRSQDELGALAEDFRTMQKELLASRCALEAEKTRYAELNELKERLRGNMPHEFKTPLTAMAASIEILRAETPLSAGERARLLDSLYRSILRLQFLVENMLDAASIQAGQFRVRMEPVPLASILEEAHLFIRPLLDQKGQTLQIHEATGGALAQADPARMAQVLLNLLSNANKYGEPGSVIEIQTACEENHLRVWVHNCGEPIPPEIQARVFERFSRGLAAGGETGTGLGLAIARTIVEMHGGEIGLTSTVESGTTVWFTLPLAAANGLAYDLDDD